MCLTSGKICCLMPGFKLTNNVLNNLILFEVVKEFRHTFTNHLSTSTYIFKLIEMLI